MFYGRGQINIVNYRLRPVRAVLLLALGFMFGSIFLPEYLVTRHQHYAGINASCVQRHPLPAPMGR
ncbi:MAG: hypothetical protein JO266_15275 [Acidobacteria bacterium]|nr:hypothetical protein [Acidobacteriota bacterium]